MGERYRVYKTAHGSFKWTVFDYKKNESIARCDSEDIARYIMRLLQKDDE